MTTRVVATAGHVDHGKSTLIRALTGTDPDRLAEEKRRGLTIELGFAHLVTASGVDVHFIDVPGHVRFIKTMLAGVGAVDACMLVVAATEGWKPQTEEHLRILELLGLTSGVVVVTLADRADPDLLELALLEVAERTAGTFLEGAEVVPVDSLSGRGLPELCDALDRLASSTTGHPEEGRPRLWVDRSFVIAGAGTVVTGTLTGGRLALDDEVELITDREDHLARARGLQSFNRNVSLLDPGCRAAVNLSGVSHRAIHRGDALVTPQRWHKAQRVDASLTAMTSLSKPIRNGGAYIAYIGSGEHAVRLRLLGPARLEAGGQGLVRLSLPRALPLLPGDRYVLRDSGSSTTVGGGEILDVDPVLQPSRARPDRSVDRVVAERGWVEPVELERLTGTQREATVGRWVVDPVALADKQNELQGRVQAAGLAGLDIAELDERERATIEADDAIVVSAGRAQSAAAEDPYAAHPFLDQLRSALYSPAAPAEAGVSNAEVSELVRRGLVIREDGIVFAPEAVAGAAAAASQLLLAAPEGFTVSGLREALGTTRRFTMALVSILDREGMTRRRGDVRIAGPRLPAQAPAR